MKINRQALAKAVDDALAAHKAAHERRAAEYTAHQQQRLADWVASHSETWDKAALVIRRKVKKGEPITRDDLPNENTSWRDLLVFDPQRPGRGAPRDPGAYIAPYELCALRKALDLITDDEISSTGLRSLGITAATLRDAVAQLGRAEASK